MRSSHRHHAHHRVDHRADARSGRAQRVRFVLSPGLALVGVMGIAAAVAPVEPPMHGVLQEVDYEVRGERVPDFTEFVPLRTPNADAPVATVIERISTVVPWPRGLAFVDGELIALARGRHRSGGGVGADLNDRAGTLYRIDPSIAERVQPGERAGEAVRMNGRILVEPTEPPFFMYDHSVPPETHLLMTRPYCGLDFDPISRNLFICAFAGAELDGGASFRKHATDSLLRFDLRDAAWRIVEQHDHTVVPESALGHSISNEYYPHHDPRNNPPPHGWLNGNTGCRVVGDFLYATSKDNHLVVQYDLRAIRERADTPAPQSRPVLGPRVTIRVPQDDGGQALREIEFLGAATVAAHDGWLYVGTRTSSIVIRVPIDDRGDVIEGEPAELIAIFEPWSVETGRSGDMFDMQFNSSGDLFISMARSGRIWRLTPDPAAVFYGNDQSGRELSAPPFVDMTQLLGKRTSCGNIAFDDQDRMYICTRNNDVDDGPMAGVIYRVDAK